MRIIAHNHTHNKINPKNYRSMISVCIASYNGSQYIKEQLLSIIPQLGPDDEIIISDDGSTDDTLAIVESLHSPLIRVVQGPCLGYPTPNFENALREAKGDYIFLSDQDDVWCDNKVEKMMSVLATADCVVSDSYVTDGNLKVIHPSLLKHTSARPNRLYNLLVRNGYIGEGMAFRRCIADRALPFPKNFPAHDIWIGNIGAYFGRLVFLHEPLTYYRRHTSNFSTVSEKSKNPLLVKLKIRFKIILELIKRKKALLRTTLNHEDPIL